MALIVSNRIIETPIKDIIELLRQQLFFNKIHKLDKIEYKQNNIRVTCPIHAGGHERTPSCDILMEDKGDTPAGTVHCFGCGYKAGIVKFIADCLNISYKSATEWLLSVTKYNILSEVRQVDILDFEDKAPIKWPIIPLEELKQYEKIHPYMYKRKLTDEIIDKFDIGYDEATNAITFPLYVNGECVLVAKRKVDYKFFIMPTIDPKPIYGLDYLTDNEVIVCESIINALTCWVYGKQAIALCGTGSAWQIEQLNKLPQRKIILALDGDEAGRKGTKRIQKAINDKIVTVLKLPDGKDINDLSKEEFDNLEEEWF